MSRYAKTVVAAVISVLIILVQVVQTQSADGVWDTNDWLVSALAVLGAVGVYFTPNRPPAGQAADPDISEQDHH